MPRTKSRLPDRILSLLAENRDQGLTVKSLADTLCAPGADAGYRVRNSLEALARRDLVVRDGDVWHAAS